jgi:hypothetical protein
VKTLTGTTIDGHVITVKVGERLEEPFAESVVEQAVWEQQLVAYGNFASRTRELLVARGGSRVGDELAGIIMACNLRKETNIIPNLLILQ